MTFLENIITVSADIAYSVTTRKGTNKQTNNK